MSSIPFSTSAVNTTMATRPDDPSTTPAQRALAEMRDPDALLPLALAEAFQAALLRPLDCPAASDYFFALAMQHACPARSAIAAPRRERPFLRPFLNRSDDSLDAEISDEERVLSATEPAPAPPRTDTPQPEPEPQVIAQPSPCPFCAECGLELEQDGVCLNCSKPLKTPPAAADDVLPAALLSKAASWVENAFENLYRGEVTLEEFCAEAAMQLGVQLGVQWNVAENAIRPVYERLKAERDFLEEQKAEAGRLIDAALLEPEAAGKEALVARIVAETGLSAEQAGIAYNGALRRHIRSLEQDEAAAAFKSGLSNPANFTPDKVDKRRQPMSEEQKKAMSEGRKAAAERKRAVATGEYVNGSA